LNWQREKEKRNAAFKAIEYVEEGMVLGLGTGTTVYYFLKALGKEIKESHFKIKCVPSSVETEKIAREFGIPLTTLQEERVLDLTVDGADEVDKAFNLIKGGGGALLREKLLASNSKKEIIIVDSSKLVEKLGGFPLPVEVVQFGVELTKRKLEGLGAKVEHRRKEGELFVTDNGNYILDCQFAAIEEPKKLETIINLIPGVVENGLFVGLVDMVLVGEGDEVKVLKKGKGK